MINWSEILITTHQIILVSVRVAWVENNIGHLLIAVKDTQLTLVHSDVCRKISEISVEGVLTFTDDKSRYSWVYILKTKDQVFDYFLEWKALVQKATKKKIKTLRTDNGGEYTSM